MTTAVDTTPTREARARSGKHHRKATPLEAHAELVPDAGDPVELLDSQTAIRVAELVPVRYGRMLVSAFTHYRGAALLMASDLAGGPRTDLTVQLCGDAHLSNFGLFASPERQLVFDLNDFDETHPGPFEWDVKRLTASLEIAGRDNGYLPAQRRQVVLAAVETYRAAMREFALQPDLTVWYAHRKILPGLPGLRELRSKTDRRAIAATIGKAQTRDSLGSLRKLTEVVDGNRRFISQPPLIVPARELSITDDAQIDVKVWMGAMLGRYAATLQPDRRRLISQYDFVDLARKVVGVGSVGTRAWVVLLTGIDQSDVLILQAKQATNSVLEPYTQPSEYEHQGERVVQGQRLMQAYGDILLGWQRPTQAAVPADYYIRQLRDWKASIEVAGLSPDTLAAYARLCAWTLARAHARSGDRVAIAAYLGAKDTFDRAIADFSVAYADKNERDYSLLAAAEKSGRITAEYGV